jgi:hypothetical protein
MPSITTPKRCAENMAFMQAMYCPGVSLQHCRTRTRSLPGMLLAPQRDSMHSEVLSAADMQPVRREVGTALATSASSKRQHEHCVAALHSAMHNTRTTPAVQRLGHRKRLSMHLHCSAAACDAHLVQPGRPLRLAQLQHAPGVAVLRPEADPSQSKGT